MNVTSSNAWLRIRKGVRRLVVGPGDVASKGPIPGRRCLAHDYAGCSDFTHCPSCSSLEQILRTAPWIEKNWQRTQDDKDPATRPVDPAKDQKE